MVRPRGRERARSACARTSPLRRSIRYSFADGLFGEVVTACTTGAVLTAWALFLEGSPFFIGALTGLPFLAQFLHVPAALVIERLGRRRMALVSWLLARSVYALLIPLPFLPLSLEVKQTVLFSVAAVSAVFTVIATNAWTAWMSELIPTAIRGRYYGRRYALAMLGGALSSVGAGVLLDVGGDHTSEIGWGLALVSLGIVASGSISTACLWKQKEARPLEKEERLEVRMALRPFFDAAAQPLLRYQLLWNVAVALSAPFVILHMAVNLKLGFVIISAHAVVSAASRIVFSALWGRLVDRLGARPVIVFCSFGICTLPLAFIFPTADLWWPIWIDAVLAGVLWSGHAVAIFSLPLRLAPAKGRAAYIAAFTAVAGVGYGVSSMLGGVIAKALPERVVWGEHVFVNFHFLFFLSFLARLTAAWLSLRIVERDSRDVPELMDRLSGAVARRALYVGRLATAPLAWGLGWARR